MGALLPRHDASRCLIPHKTHVHKHPESSASCRNTGTCAADPLVMTQDAVPLSNISNHKPVIQHALTQSQCRP